MTLKDVAIALDRASAPAGSATFLIRNAGTVVHELVLLKTDVPHDRIQNDPSQPGKVDQRGLIGQTPKLAPGATTTLTLALAPGAYVLLCNEPAHYLIGMHTAFTIN